MAKQKKSKATDVDSDNLVNEEVEVEVEEKTVNQLMTLELFHMKNFLIKKKN